MAYAMTNSCPSYSGLLYTKSNLDTPFFNSICAPKYTTAQQFPVSQTYSLGSASQPAITETASQTAPTESFISRTQQTNVTQIFHEAIAVTYAKMANAGLMSGINAAGQTPNPLDERNWQIQQRMKKIANDIEYTFLNGVYQLNSNDTTAAKTRGIITACTTNVLDNSGVSRALTKTLLKSLLKSVFDNGGQVHRGILMMDSAQKVALTNLFDGQTGFIVPSSRNVGGANITTLVSDFGDVDIMVNRLMPSGTILFYNPEICAPVEQNTPGKGNFFYEELAKTGAAERGQIFGMIGLDYGAEWMHGVLKDLS